MSAISKIRFASFQVRQRSARVASVVAATAAIAIPLAANAGDPAPWELRFGNDTSTTMTSTFTWTYDRHLFQTSDVQTLDSTDKLVVYRPSEGKVVIGGDVFTKFPNDYHVHSVSKSHGVTDVIDFSGKVPLQGTSNDVRGALDNFPGRLEFLLPVPAQPGGELFTGVDMSQYFAHPLDSVPSSVTFVDGVSSDLPGYLVGLSPVTVDPATDNYVTSAPFSGTVQFDALVTIASIPEPRSGLLLAVGLAALGGWRRLARGRDRGSMS